MRFKIPRTISWKYVTDLGYSLTLLGVGQAFNYFFSVNLANRLTAYDFGVFSTIVAMIYLLSVLATTIQNAFTKVVAQHYEHDLREFYQIQLIRFAFISLIGAGVVFAVAPWLAHATQLPLPYVRLFSLYVIVSLFTFVPRGFLLGKQQVKLTNTLIFLETTGKFAWSFWVATATGAIWAYVVPSLISGVIMAFFVRFKPSKPTLPKLEWMEYFRIFTVILLVQLPFSLDVLLSNPNLRPSYAALALLGKIIFFGSTIITGVMFANAAKDRTAKARRQKLLVALGVTAVVGLVISIGYFIFPSNLIHIVFHDRYPEIGAYLGWYGLSFTLYAIGFTCSNYLIIVNRYRQTIGLLAIIVLQAILLLNYTSNLHALVVNQGIIFALVGAYLLWETWAATNARNESLIES